MAQSAPRPSSIRNQTVEGFVFVYWRVFPGRTVDQVNQTIMQWLKDNRARGVREEPPNTIHAIHGSYWRLGWSLKAKKKMNFAVIAKPGEVLVRMTITPVGSNLIDVGLMQREAEINWAILADDVFWRIDQDASSPSSPAPIRAKKVTEKEWKLRRQVRFGVCAALLGVLVVIPFSFILLSDQPSD